MGACSTFRLPSPCRSGSSSMNACCCCRVPAYAARRHRIPRGTRTPTCWLSPLATTLPSHSPPHRGQSDRPGVFHPEPADRIQLTSRQRREGSRRAPGLGCATPFPVHAFGVGGFPWCEVVSPCIGLVRRVKIIFALTRCRGFGLGLAITHQKCAQKPGGRRAPPPQPRIKWYGCLAPRLVMYVISGDGQTGAAIAPLSANTVLGAG